MATNKTPETKKPSGLTIERNGNSITVGWKIESANHDAGQQLKSKITGISTIQQSVRFKNASGQMQTSTKLVSTPEYEIWSSKPDIEKNATSHTFSIGSIFNGAYPATLSYLHKFQFSIKGRRAKYKNKKKVEITPKYSDYVTKSKTIHPPRKPSISEALSQASDVTAIFSWQSTVSDSDWYIFKDYEWESVLTKNGASPDWYSNKVVRGTASSSSSSRTVDDTLYTWSISKGQGTVEIGENSNALYPNTFDSYSNKVAQSHTRWFRVRARGPAGPSDWVQTKHVYAIPNRVGEHFAAAATRQNNGAGTAIRAVWTVSHADGHPIDFAQLQYSITTPKINHTAGNDSATQSLGVPENLSWTDCPGGTIRESSGKDSAQVIIPEIVAEDQALYVRVNTTHDRKTRYGQPIIPTSSSGSIGRLKAPSGLQIGEYDSDTGKVSITVPKNNSAVENSYIAIYLRTDNKSNPDKPVAIIPWGQDSGTRIIPIGKFNTGETPGLGMETLVGSYKLFSSTPIPSDTPGETPGYVKKYAITKLIDCGGIDWSSGRISMPPTITVDRTDGRYDSLTVDWDWSDSEATGMELSWSTDALAWQSVTDPSKYEVSAVNDSKRYINGLTPGDYSVRGRFVTSIGENTSYGSYSKRVDRKIASTPDAPLLQSSKYQLVYKEADGCILYWTYSNADGTKHGSSQLIECTKNADGSFTDIGEPFYEYKSSTYDQKLRFNPWASPFNRTWQAGTDHFIRVRTISSEETKEASDWSDPIMLRIVPLLTASISSSSLSPQVINERSRNVLSAMPISVAVTSSANTDGSAKVYIERINDYSIHRPDRTADEEPIDGYADETIAVVDLTSGSGTVTITNEMLLGSLDDGEDYRIVAVVKDSFNQKVETTPLEFTVAWAHKAQKIGASIVVDEENLVTVITPDVPETGVVEGDCVDIYRLSVDAPQLIIQNGSFGTQYVDPYPALGEFGGHRIVYKTLNQDFVTADKQLAMTDYGADSEEQDVEDTHHTFAIVIDFPGGQVRLPYNVEISNRWTKDFKETKYLGGSVHGDWNPAVSRTASLRTVSVVEEDSDMIRLVRRLAMYPGLCHIRTPEGSSFVGDVEVSEDRENKMVNKLVNFSFEMTRVDNPTLDGLTYAEWIHTEPETEVEVEVTP